MEGSLGGGKPGWREAWVEGSLGGGKPKVPGSVLPACVGICHVVVFFLRHMLLSSSCNMRSFFI